MANIFWKSEAGPVLRALDAGHSPVLISGIGPASRAHMAAALRRGLEAPLVVVCPDDTAAEQMARDLGFLLDTEPALLSLRDFGLYAAESASRSAEQRRLGTLDALLRGGSAVTVCSIGALLERTMPPELLGRAALEITDGQEIAMEAVEKALLAGGYVHRLEVDAPGQYSRRGGILDFFSPAYADPVRVEFWGDEIDSMGLFDTKTQRRTEIISAARILPASETLPQLCPGGAAALADALGELAVKARRGRSPVKEKLAETLMADAEKLRETGSLAAADRYMGLIYPAFACGADYIGGDCLVFLSEPARCARQAEDQEKLLAEDLKALIESGGMSGAGAEYRRSYAEFAQSLGERACVLADNFVSSRCLPEPRSIVNIIAKQLGSYAGSLDAACDDVKSYLERGFTVLVLAPDRRRCEALRDAFAPRGINADIIEGMDSDMAEGRCLLCPGAMSAGFEYTESRLALMTDSQISRPAGKKPRHRAPDSNRQKLTSCADLAVGDLVVHEYHGIGRFDGIVKMRVDGADMDYIKICYAGTDVLYVPATALDLVGKYIGAGGEDKPVRLSKMGGADWTRVKTRAKAAAREMAGQLIQLYAERRRRPGHAFAPDSPWQTEFEQSFGYQETEDQLRCIDEIKGDMERPVPMDRLLCGDVGFGKTEVALRAAFKCVSESRQCVILVPTTILAFQHYNTIVRRFEGFPVQVDMLSRFRTPKEQESILRRAASGELDILVGTHRMLSKDVKFHNLGRFIVEEEQRFGVSQKERIKELAPNIDVLTLSATPIPRTLNMAMSGIRDMSVIEEAPQDRRPVQTYVLEHDHAIITDAIRRELRRGGQVYYLHNRVETIERCAAGIQMRIPEARVAFAHGKMSEDEMSEIWRQVLEHEIDVLVCTTIIETGVDVPNVNTLIIENADRFGLSQLHQLRGRVGRSSRRAFAFLTFVRGKVLSDVASKRLEAIREFTEFGAGFKIAMRDMEIRGAGNLLGSQQHGHMEAVGYEMYLKLLADAVNEEKGLPSRTEEAECLIDLPVAAHIPESYISSNAQRLDVYRRIADIRTEEDSLDVYDELIDRFGEPPEAVQGLIDVALLRNMAAELGIYEIKQQADTLLLFQRKLDLAAGSRMSAALKGRVMINAGPKPYLAVKVKPGLTSLDTLREALQAAQETSSEPSS